MHNQTLSEQITMTRQDELSEKVIGAMERFLATEEISRQVDADENEKKEKQYDIYDAEEGLVEFQEATPIVMAMIKRRFAKTNDTQAILTTLSRKEAVIEANAWSDFCDFIVHGAFKAPEIKETDDLNVDDIERIVRRVNIDFEFVEKYLTPLNIRIIRDARCFFTDRARDYHTTPFLEFTVGDEQHLINLILTPIYYVGWFRIVEGITSELEDLAGKYVEQTIEEVAEAEAAKSSADEVEPWLLT